MKAVGESTKLGLQPPSSPIDENGPPMQALPSYEVERLQELLKWVGEHIKLVNALGKKSDKFCIFCRRSQNPVKFCKHNEIWEVSGTQP